MANLNDALNLAQEALERCYWDEEKQYYEHHFPRKEEEAFVYWWHAVSYTHLTLPTIA